MRYVTLIFLLFTFLTSLNSQIITGKVIDGTTFVPVVGAEVRVVGTDFIEFTNSQGIFRLQVEGISNGQLIISTDEYEASYIDINLTEGNLDIGKELVFKRTNFFEDEAQDGFAVISAEDLSTQDNDDDVSGLLAAGWDPFNSLANFNYNAVRYNIRGYLVDRGDVYLNNIRFNDIEDNQIYWGTWGGMNDVFRVRTSEQGLFKSDFGNGGLAGITNIDLRASSQWSQLKATYNSTNISYQNRVMVTYNTGLSQKGWAFSFLASKRWAESGYIPGTYYDAYSYFAGVSKTLGEKQSIHLNVFGSQNRRGRGTSSVQEAFDLTNDNFYNPNWGYQAGKVRNSREYRTHQPISILQHDVTPNRNFKISSSIAYQTGHNASTALDWFQASDPRPDYYRNLPSFLESDQLANQLTTFYQENPEELQLNWDEMILINKNRSNSVDGIGGLDVELPEGNLSAYIIEERHFDQEKIAAQSHFNAILGTNATLAGGLQLTYDQNKSFKILDDLLGGDFSIDLDEFALRDFPDSQDVAQHDLQNPNRIIFAGDRFGYDFTIHNQRAELWAAGEYAFKRFDLFIGLNGSNTRFWREGNVQDGKFPENSLGKGEVQSFINGQAKVGLTYKINGRNYLYANGLVNSQAPLSRNAYISPRTRHDLVSNLKSMTTQGGEIGYIARFPNLNARITGFYTLVNDLTLSRNFYNDELRTFVNYIITNVDTKHAGFELGIDYKLTSTIRIRNATTLGKYLYNSRPIATISQDNSAAIFAEDRLIYLQDFNLAGMPRIASSLQLEYRSPKFWSVSLAGNYFDQRYTDVNPERRTVNAVDGIVKSEDPELFNEIIAQEKLGDALTLNFFGIKSFQIADKYRLQILVSVNNILDNTDIRKSGFEQLRFDYEEKDVDRFANRYYYNFGRTYNIGVTLRM